MISAWVAIAVLGATPDECREAYAALNYREAAVVCVAVLPTAPAGELAGLYRLAGLSLAASGNAERAFQVFSSLLSLDPAYELDDSVSPRLREPFDRAKRARGGAKVTVKAQLARPLVDGQPIALTVSVDDGPGRPIARISAKSPSGEVTAPRADHTSLELPPLTGTAVRVELGGYDTFGGRVFSDSSVFAVPARASPRPVLLSWRLWTGAAAVVLGAASASGIASRVLISNAANDHFADDKARHLQLGATTAILADVGFAVGGALAIAALVLWLTEPRLTASPAAP
jgi:hypothetical protein